MPPTRAVWLCVALAPSACMDARDPHDLAPVAVPDAVPSAAPPATAPPLPDPVKLVPPAPAACQLDFSAHLQKRSEVRRRGAAEYPLAFAAGRPPFATVVSASKGEVTVPVGPASAGLFLDADFDGGAVGGVIPATALRLFAQRAFTLRGILVPRSAARLELHGGAPGKLIVRYPDPEDARLRMLAGPLEDATPCADAGPEQATFDARDALPGKALRTMYLVAKAPIAATEKGAPIAELTPTEGDDAALVLAEAGKLAHIAVERRTAWVVGWVPRSALRAKPPGVGVGSNGPIPGPPSRSALVQLRMRQAICTRDVDLLAYQGDEGRIVGKVRAGTTIRLPHEHAVAGQWAIWLALPGLHVDASAELRVRERDLADCAITR